MTATSRTAADVLYTQVQATLHHDLAATVAWYRAAMPKHYFQVTGADEQVLHLETIHSLRRTADARLTLIDDPAHGKLLVFGRPDRHSLAEVIPLVAGHPLAGTASFNRVELHVSGDDSLFLYAFGYGAGTVAPSGFNLPAHRQAILSAVCGAKQDCSVQAARFLDSVDQGYLARSSVERVVRHVTAWASLNGAEDIAAHTDTVEGMSRIQIAAGGASLWPVLAHVARVVTRHHLRLERGYLDWVVAVQGGDGRALLASLYVSNGGKPLAKPLQAEVEADLSALREAWGDTLAAQYADGTYTIGELALLRAVAGIAGTLISPDHPYLDVTEVATEVIRQRVPQAKALTGLIAARFTPGSKVKPATWAKSLAALQAEAHTLDVPAQALVLEAMLAVVAAIQLTNAYRPGHLGLAFKLDPAVLPVSRFPQPAYGLFAFAGPHARGFHVRFRASARGGLRLLLPKGPAHWAKARDGILREVYDLAWAQQLKNKDIPEGGSKCIALVEPGADPDAAVRQVTDSLIDLLLPDLPEIVGPHGAPRQPDLVFLGPDENMTPARITWVANRAKARNLPHAPTLMSSKPGSGINHKEFGVTSEGIFRWVVQALPRVGIADGQPYTVKITGGPDGDVAGNLLKILHREHGKRCRVLAISDGTGSALDPAGLDWRELLRLVRDGLGIAKFDPAKLASKAGKVVPATDRPGELLRNDLHNTIAADVFLPCGGRPYTIDDHNWSRFLHDGKPSAKTMVEGANIFLTPGARKHLEDAGLLVIKDSSANKGGVICSSYEVLAGLVCEDAEFLAMKPVYVKEVVGIIRARADAEAKALFSAWRRRGGSVRLSDLSQQLSSEINRVSGAIEPLIEAHLDDADLAETWRRHLDGHAPAVLVQRYGSRFAARIPRAHRVAILAKRLASRMVYKEGLTWCGTYLRSDQPELLWETLATYLAAETEVAAVCERLRSLGLPDGDLMLKVVATGAQRELVRLRLGQEF